jgi:hypothetical protein
MRPKASGLVLGMVYIDRAALSRPLRAAPWQASGPAGDAQRVRHLENAEKINARVCRKETRPMPFAEEAMKNHCAYCHGKFGLVRHRRAFKCFCSQKCVDHYEAWLCADVGKRKGGSVTALLG